MIVGKISDDKISDINNKWLPSQPQGHRSIRVMRRLILAGIALDIAVGIIVALSVPLDTTVSYTRLSREIQILIFSLLGFPIILGLWWLQSRKAAFEPLPPNERKLLFTATILLYAVMVIGQLFVAKDYLEAGGASS